MDRKKISGLGPKDIIVLWIYMDKCVEEGVDIRNKVMIVVNTQDAEERHVVAQKYVDNMQSNMLEQCIQHEQSNLNTTSMHMEQVKNTSHVSQQGHDEDWVDTTDGRKPTSIEWFSFDISSIS